MTFGYPSAGAASPRKPAQTFRGWLPDSPPGLPTPGLPAPHGAPSTPNSIARGGLTPLRRSESRPADPGDIPTLASPASRRPPRPLLRSHANPGADSKKALGTTTYLSCLCFGSAPRIAAAATSSTSTVRSYTPRVRRAPFTLQSPGSWGPRALLNRSRRRPRSRLALSGSAAGGGRAGKARLRRRGKARAGGREGRDLWYSKA